MMMRYWFAAAFLLLSPSALMALSDAPPMPEWMVGAWQYEAGEDWADEYWTPLRGDLMMGSSRSGKAERTTFWEHMRIEKEDDGGIVFVALSADQKPVRFDMVVSMEREVVFENEAHDYPQRIRYWREGKVLNAEISLIDGSKAKAYSWRKARQ
jgi:Domain of unknown function (DUF6265)